MKVVILTGPTGVGKTKLALKIAQKYKVAIINADAFQIYQDMEILSASPTQEEKKIVPHILFNFLSPSNEFSIYEYQKIMRGMIEKYGQTQDFVFLVGGSGLYINSVIYDYDLSSEKKSNLTLSDEEVYQKLKELNPTATSLIHENNKRRLKRAYELSLQDKFNEKQTTSLYYDSLVIVLNMDRSALYETINNRVDKMIEDGLIDEVKKLKEENLSKTASQAIGYKEMVPYLNQEITLDEAINKIKQNSRHLAKHQLTWFKNKMESHFVNKENNYEEEVNKLIDDFLERKCDASK